MSAHEEAKLQARISRLETCLDDLVRYYVANLGTKSEFISCITPRSASSMTKVERKACPAWSKWDAARNALAKEKTP